MTSGKSIFWQDLEKLKEFISQNDKKRAQDLFSILSNSVVGDDPSLIKNRQDLLQKISELYGLEYSAPRDAAVDRILVNGIGRSGTTLIYQQLAKLLLLDDRKVNFRYEPYLWNIRSAEAKGNAFDMSQLHQFGLLTHTTTPLFLDGAHSAHDPFIDHLFNERWDQNPDILPDSYLTKVIRGSGRLRSYLRRYPDLKIVACLRNPVDTINSSLGMFSFFGEEFHADDRPRFREELSRRKAATSHLDPSRLTIEWYAEWWQAFTEEMLAIAADHSENVFLFCYEAFQQDSDALLESLQDFVGIRNLGMHLGLSQPAGPTIKATSLTQHDIGVLSPNIAYYQETVLSPRLGAKTAAERTDKVLSRYLQGRFSFPIAGSDLGRKCPIQLRGMMLNGVGSPFQNLVRHTDHPISLSALIDTHHPSDAAELKRPVSGAEAVKRGKTFGAVVTCHNNADTIVGAVLSCLNQTLPFDQIVVVNDKSTDASARVLGELVRRYSSLTLLDLPSNLGPAAARDLGIRKLTTEFFTQLDGDDLFWPTKNVQEAAAIDGDERTVAFSDILLAKPGDSLVQSTASYHGRTGAEAWHDLLARRPQIPRDMTISRKLYFEAGGYDMTLHLYEDWEFKLRLATKSRAWARADGLAGTVYNRLSPGLSGVHDGLHARALSQIFLRALDADEARRGDLLSAYTAMIGRFGPRHVALRTKSALEAFLARPGRDIGALSAFASRRDMSVPDNITYSEEMSAFVARQTKAEVEA